MPSLASPSGKYGCLYGNMKLGMVFGDRRQVTIRKSLERYFDSDTTGILGTERISIVPHGTLLPITGATGLAANGPIVALKIG